MTDDPDLGVAIIRAAAAWLAREVELVLSAEADNPDEPGECLGPADLAPWPRPSC